MKVLVFGASGGTGRELVKQALAQKHAVIAYVRDQARFDIKHADLRVVVGDVKDYASVEGAVRGQDAVLSALGAASPLKRNPTLTEGVRNIIRAMEQAGVRRFIYVSFLGVSDSRDQMGFLGQHIIAPFVLHKPTADHEVKEGLIKESRLDWTIVRPPKLTSGPRTGVYRSGERVEPKSVLPSISRADVADFMLKQLVDDAYLRKAPSVMY